MKVEIVTPDKKVFEGEAEGVQLPGADGSFEILNNHAPIISSLTKGTLRIRHGKKIEQFVINGGLAEMQNNTLVVLVESLSQ